MKLTIDIDSQSLLDPVSLGGGAPAYKIGRNDTIPAQVAFVSGGALTDLPTGATVKVQINKAGSFGGNGLVQGLTSTLTGSGPDALYEVVLTPNTTEQSEAFVESPEFVSASIQVEWAHGSYKFSSELGAVTMHNEIVL